LAGGQHQGGGFRYEDQGVKDDAQAADSVLAQRRAEAAAGQDRNLEVHRQRRLGEVVAGGPPGCGPGRRRPRHGAAPARCRRHDGSLPRPRSAEFRDALVEIEHKVERETSGMRETALSLNGVAEQSTRARSV
jgi:methyl-accepting chemotaxis protein